MPTYTGTPGNDVLIGNAEDDTFFGNGGDDRFEGRNGNDVYFVDDQNDVVVEFIQHGYDTIYTGSSYVLGANSFVEVLSTVSHAAATTINLTGNYLDNLLLGNAGANILNGGGGAGDRLVGYAGDDIYFIDFATVQVFEEAADGSYMRGGRDTAYVSVSYVLAANVSVEILSTNFHAGTAAINITGNNLNNEIYGNAGANILDGGGGSGDVLVGFGGDDSYRVGVATTRVFESVGGGTDTVYASVDYALSNGQSIERLATGDEAGTAPLALTGNEIANEIRGNAGANILRGGGGADVLVGLNGNDTYYVDSADDEIVETATGGDRDVVYSSANYSLATFAGGQHVEILSTISHGSTAAIDLTGSSDREEIYGNAGVNTLDGGGGNDVLVGFGGDDTLLGGADNDRLEGYSGNDILDGGTGADSLAGGTGDDTYYVDTFTGDGKDVVFEFTGEGTDTLYSSAPIFGLNPDDEIEILAASGPIGPGGKHLGGNDFAQEMRGDAGSNTLLGQGGDDVLLGFEGVDTLSGGTGLDTLTGGTGADTFFFDQALGATNVDTITDHEVGIDVIRLSSGVFNTTTGALRTGGAFHTGPSAADANDRIIYDSATGALYYDADGLGGTAQIQFATLAPGLALTGNDFVVGG